MDDYILTKQQHGFTIRTTETCPRVWAFSTLDEMLNGLRKLYEEQTKQE